MRRFAPENYILLIVLLVAMVGVGSLFFQTADLHSVSLTGHVVGAVVSGETSTDSSSSAVTCTDSDGGINPFIQGTVSNGFASGKWITNMTDYCDNTGNLTETSCINATHILKRRVSCLPYLCADGACYNDANQDRIISADEETQQEQQFSTEADIKQIKKTIESGEKANIKKTETLFKTILSYIITLFFFGTLSFIFIPLLRRNFQVFRAIVIIFSLLCTLLLLFFSYSLIRIFIHRGNVSFLPAIDFSLYILLFLTTFFVILYALYLLFFSSQAYKKHIFMGILSLLLFIPVLILFASLIFHKWEVFDFILIPVEYFFSTLGGFFFILLSCYFFGVITPDVEKTLPAQQTPLQSQESLFHVNYHPVLGRFLQISTTILVLHELYFMVTEGVLPLISNPTALLFSLPQDMILSFVTFFVLYRIFSLGSLFLEPEEKNISYRKTVIVCALFTSFLSFIGGIVYPIISLISSSTILFSTASLSSLFDIFGSLLFIICSLILCQYYMKNGE